jgi:uncharacterized protein
MFDFSLQQWFLVAAIALMIGASKGGVPGVGILVVPLMANIFPAKVSTGILLPMLLMADGFAVMYYHRHADWKLLRQLLPSSILGIGLSALFMNYLDDQQVKFCIGLIILCMVLIMLLREMGYIQQNLPKTFLFTSCIGVSVGCATMLANAAGPIAGLYLLALGMEKNEFIGTRAWFFLLINAIKVPFSISLGLISKSSLIFNFQCLPLIIIGVFIGIATVKKISPKLFSRLVILLAAISAVRML